jgi:hypothetical protein
MFWRQSPPTLRPYDRSHLVEVFGRERGIDAVAAILHYRHERQLTNPSGDRTTAVGAHGQQRIGPRVDVPVPAGNDLQPGFLSGSKLAALGGVAFLVANAVSVPKPLA